MYNVEYILYQHCFFGHGNDKHFERTQYCCVVHHVVVIHMCCYMSVCNSAAIGRIMNQV